MNKPGLDYNLARAALRRADLNPERVAVVFEERQISFHFVDELPRNPAGKVLKYVLKERLAD